MLLRLSASLHYPITVTALLKQPGDSVKRDEALFWYVYRTTVTEGDGLGNKIEVKRDFPAKFESAVDGEIVQWKIKQGDVINYPYVFLCPFIGSLARKGPNSFFTDETRLTSIAM